MLKMRQLAFLMLMVACSPTVDSSTEKRDFDQPTQKLLDLIGKEEASIELAQFVKEHNLVRIIAKGDVNLSNEDEGVVVLFRNAKVWRIILHPRSFKGELPYGVSSELAPKAFYAKCRNHLVQEYPKGKEPWFISRKVGYQFVFCFDEKGEFWAVFLQKDAGPGRL